jgi:phosphoglycerate dehydrogenase-like enzyme
VKALFFGGLAASQADTIVSMIESDIDSEVLADSRDLQRVAIALDDTDILVTHQWSAAYPPAPRLKLLQAPVAGIDNIDVAALPRGVTICNAYGHEPAMAEYAVMAMLVWFHRYFEIAQSFRAGSWHLSGVGGGPMHGELAGHTVGIVGMGHIGQEVAARARALGCRVIAANRTVHDLAGIEQVFPLTELDRMLPLCDVVVLCLGLAPETRGLIDSRRLGLMRRDAFLINIGRGPVADEDALFAALRDRAIGGAALDVWYRYPTPEEPDIRPSKHPFHELPNVVMTPHCSPWTDGMAIRRGGSVARNIDRFVRGEPLHNIVATT